MAARVCLVHYHEVGLKGKNRAHFEHILMDNIKAALAAFSVNAVSRISGYILVTFNEHQADEAARVIRTVPGVARVSLAYHTNRDPQEYCAAAVKALREFGPFDSFKVHAKRSNTDYELTSIDINRQVGEVLCEAFPDKKVQMHDPDAMVHVLVVQGSVYVYARSERGVGGLPVGSAGKVVTLLFAPLMLWMFFYDEFYLLIGIFIFYSEQLAVGYRFSGGDLDARTSRRGVRAGTFLRSSADARYERVFGAGHHPCA